MLYCQKLKDMNCARFHLAWKTWTAGGQALVQMRGPVPVSEPVSGCSRCYLEPVFLLFSSPSLRNDHRNHCVPVFKVIPVLVKRCKITILPFLMHCDSPRMHYMLRVIGFIRQFLQASQGTEFLLEHNIAHSEPFLVHWTALKLIFIQRVRSILDGTKVVPSGCHFSSPCKYALDCGPLVWSDKTKHRCLSPIHCFLVDFDFAHSCPGQGKGADTTLTSLGQVTTWLVVFAVTSRKNIMKRKIYI
ncbi:hypothetical protein C8J56DRAFT_33634 [Mycena floridula]|nr:hypothetical protein C8J56DRAFT_33634 [Mycena floridula]